MGIKKTTQTRESIVMEDLGENLHGIYDIDIDKMDADTLKAKGHAMSSIKDALKSEDYHNKDKDNLTHTMETAARLARGQLAYKIWTMTREQWIDFIEEEENTQEAIRNNEIANEILNKIIGKDTKATTGGNKRRKSHKMTHTYR